MELAIAAAAKAATAVATTAAAAPLTTAAALASGYAAYKTTDAANKSAKANANALATEAELTKQQGLEAEVKQRQKIATLIGDQKQAYASSGIDVTAAGTPVDVFKDTKDIGEADALTIRSNMQRRITSYQQQQEAETATISNPWLSAGTTVLTNFAGSKALSAMASKFSSLTRVGKAATAANKATKTWQGSALKGVKNLA